MIPINKQITSQTTTYFLLTFTIHQTAIQYYGLYLKLLNKPFKPPDLTETCWKSQQLDC